MRPGTVALAGVVTIACWWMLAASPASALSLDNPVCDATGAVSGTASACTGIAKSVGGDLLTSGKQLITGHPGQAINTAVGGAVQTVASTTSGAFGATIGAWVLGSAQGVLDGTATVLAETTAPQLRTTWFSSTYWRMAAIAAVLTLPFLFAAAVQALIRSDIALLVRATFGYLPLAMLAIAIAAPLTMLLLAASDEMSGFISSAAGNASGHFLAKAGVVITGLSAATESPFLIFLVGLFTIGAAFGLWIELLMREAAVYVIVLMLPLAFAAMVWPARRVWAVRAVELLVALILSKFAIVAVLSLGGAAISSGADHGSVSAVMTGAVLIMLAAFSPWVLLRLIPMAELASGAAGSFRAELGRAGTTARSARAMADEWGDVVTAAMRRDAADGEPNPGPPRPLGGGGPAPDTGADRPAPDGGGPGGDGPGGDGPGGDAPGRDGPGGDGPEDAAPTELIVNWSRMPALELGAGGVGSGPIPLNGDAA